jgi:hypothetical protein
MKKAKPVKVTIAIDPKIWHGAGIVAALKGISRQELVALALVNFFDKRVPKKELDVVYYGSKPSQVNAA